MNDLMDGRNLPVESEVDWLVRKYSMNDVNVSRPVFMGAVNSDDPHKPVADLSAPHLNSRAVLVLAHEMLEEWWPKPDFPSKARLAQYEARRQLVESTLVDKVRANDPAIQYEWLMTAPNCGKATVAHINEFLAAYGLKLPSSRYDKVCAF